MSRGEDLTKIYHEAQPPHEVSTPFHCSQQMTLLSPFTCNNPLKLPQKESNYLSTTTGSGFLVLGLGFWEELLGTNCRRILPCCTDVKSKLEVLTVPSSYLLSCNSVVSLTYLSCLQAIW